MTMKYKYLGKLVFIVSIVFGTNAYGQYPKDCVFYTHGECFDCNTPYTLEMSVKENCLTHCPNRVYDARRKLCLLKAKDEYDVPDTWYQKSNRVPLENCQKEGFFYDIHQEECYPCDTKEDVWVRNDCEQHDECLHKCPNRNIQYVHTTAANSVLKCPKDRPLMDVNFFCWRCDEKTPVDMSFNQERITGVPYNKQGVWCLHQRYLTDETNPLSYPCPEDKTALSKEACMQCAGLWENNLCH